MTGAWVIFASFDWTFIAVAKPSDSRSRLSYVTRHSRRLRPPVVRRSDELAMKDGKCSSTQYDPSSTCADCGITLTSVQKARFKSLCSLITNLALLNCDNLAISKSASAAILSVAWDHRLAIIRLDHQLHWNNGIETSGSLQVSPSQNRA